MMKYLEMNIKSVTYCVISVVEIDFFLLSVY